MDAKKKSEENYALMSCEWENIYGELNAAEWSFVLRIAFWNLVRGMFWSVVLKFMRSGL